MAQRKLEYLRFAHGINEGVFHGLGFLTRNLSLHKLCWLHRRVALSTLYNRNKVYFITNKNIEFHSNLD